MKRTAILIFSFFLLIALHAENGYRLWLRYDKVDNSNKLQQYLHYIPSFSIAGNTATINAAKKELEQGLAGLLGKKISSATANNGIIIGAYQSSPFIKENISAADLNNLGNEGFLIRTLNTTQKKNIVITGNTDLAVLYGVFHFLRLLQTQQDISSLAVSNTPKIEHRILNHWDNLNRYVERGYAGISIFNWHTLPDYIDQRYIDYARANASIGINGTVLTNVNANALVLTPMYLEKVAALANTFRPYGIKVYLTARFSAPVEIGKLKTADPLDTAVQNWWKEKVKEIYKYIPDFGGFLVKANSEGQPGPQNYNRTHADGANMLADAVAPYKGIVMWRAFVYSNETPEDRVKQAYSEFVPLDNKFRKNVLVQVKNGPLDFQPREPFSPLFGAMPNTPLMMEFQLTQEYLGFSTHLVYLPSLYKEVLDADTYAKGKGSTVAKIVEGALENHATSGIAGVANIGNEPNWTGHPFAQANWYGFGRLCWNPELSETQIADEWIKQTFSNNAKTVNTIKEILLASHQAVVSYMTPLGLSHIMGTGHHYGPAPWVSNAGRADWNPVYYHRADSLGIGFDRTSKGSNAVAQYKPEVQKLFEDINTCPKKYLLWFHHVPWTYKMKSGRTLWEELCYKYNEGVDSVRKMQKHWNSLKGNIDEERFAQVTMLLDIQGKEAVWWRDACLSYFQTFAKKPIPSQYEQPAHPLSYYQSLNFPYAPGNYR